MEYLNHLDLRHIWEDYWHDHMDIRVTAKQVANALQSVNSQSYEIELQKARIVEGFLTIANYQSYVVGEEEIFASYQKEMMQWGERIIDGEVKNCRIITL